MGVVAADLVLAGPRTAGLADARKQCPLRTNEAIPIAGSAALAVRDSDSAALLRSCRASPSGITMLSNFTLSGEVTSNAVELKCILCILECIG